MSDHALLRALAVPGECVLYHLVDHLSGPERQAAHVLEQVCSPLLGRGARAPPAPGQVVPVVVRSSALVEELCA